MLLVAKTPLRVSLFGGGTDLVEYLRHPKSIGMRIISFAIQHYTYVVVKDRCDSMVYLNSQKKEIVPDASKLKNKYVRAALGMAHIANGVEVTLLSDIPSTGSGLGSSSSFMVGMLHAFPLAAQLMKDSELYRNEEQHPAQESLARVATDCERNYCQTQCGYQDHLPAAYGGFASYWSARQQNETPERVYRTGLEVTFNGRQNWEFESGLYLIDTSIARQADPILKDCETSMEKKIDIYIDMAHHADEMKIAMHRGHWDVVGRGLTDSWELKKKLSPSVSTPDIDAMINLCLAFGASGAKLCGAGGGGFILAWVEYSAHEEFLKRTQEVGWSLMRPRIAKQGSRVIEVK